jgi:anti-anti-sigma factor
MDSGEELTVHIEDTDGRRTLRVEGPLDLANAPLLHQALRGAFELAAGGGRGTVVHLAGIASIDLCGLQLLCSAHRTFLACGGNICLQDAPAWFRKAAAAAGFSMRTLECRYRCGDECLWRE